MKQQHAHRGAVHVSQNEQRPRVALGGLDRPGRIVAVSALTLALTAPGQTAAVSAFVDPVQAGLHLSSSAISAAYLIGSLGGVWAMPLIGRAIDRLGPRTMMAIIGAVFGAALIGLSQVGEVIGLTAGFIGIRLAGQGALSLVATTTVALYVTRRRGLAQGITAASGGAGISLAPVLLESLVAARGYSTVWLWEGLLVWATVIPLAVLGMPRRRPAPDTIGHALALDDPLDPPGDVRLPIAVHLAPVSDPREGQPDRPDTDSTVSWTLRQEMGTGMFWLVTAGVATSGMLGTALAFHQIDLLTARGLTRTEAAANFIPQTIAGLLATVAVGWLADRVADRILISTSMVVLLLAVVSAGYVGPGWSAYGYAIAAGAAGNSIRTLEATAFPGCFGLGHIGAIRGVVHMAAVGATAFGPLVFSLGRDAFGTYRTILWICAALPALVAVACAFVRSPTQPHAADDLAEAAATTRG